MNAPLGVNPSIEDLRAISREAINLIENAVAHAEKRKLSIAQKELCDARHKLLGALDECAHLEADNRGRRRKADNDS